MKLGKLPILGHSLNHLQSCINIIPGENQSLRQNLQSRPYEFNLPIKNMLILEGAARATPSFFIKDSIMRCPGLIGMSSRSTNDGH